MRPVQRIVDISTRYQSEVRVVKDEVDINAKNILDMIEFPNYMLGKAKERDDYSFTFRARGPDAEAVLKDLAALVDRHFDMETD